MKKIFFPLIVLLFSIISFTGCIGIDRDFAKIRSKVLMNFGNNFEREAEFSIGSFGITVASWIVQFDEDEELADDILREISNVQIALYNRLDQNSITDFSSLKEVDKTISAMGWKYLVRSTADNEVTAVYIDENSEEFNRLLVITSTTEEIVIVEVEGNLDKVIQLALKDKKFDWELTQR